MGESSEKIYVLQLKALAPSITKAKLPTDLSLSV